MVPTWKMVSAGQDAICGITLDDRAWCWGQNDQGTQVCGLVAGGDAYCWVNGGPAPALVPGGHKFAAISAGGSNACGVTSGGAAWCWGTGPPGNGSAAGSTMPVRVGHPQGTPTS